MAAHVINPVCVAHSKELCGTYNHSYRCVWSTPTVVPGVGAQGLSRRAARPSWASTATRSRSSSGQPTVAPPAAPSAPLLARTPSTGRMRLPTCMSTSPTVHVALQSPRRQRLRFERRHRARRRALVCAARARQGLCLVVTRERGHAGGGGVRGRAGAAAPRPRRPPHARRGRLRRGVQPR